jgi:hypothetical protein
MGVFAVKNDVGIGTIVGAPLKLKPPDSASAAAG